jgi:hypothetical protein
MKTEEEEAKPRYGIANLERRRYRRFPMEIRSCGFRLT